MSACILDKWVSFNATPLSPVFTSRMIKQRTKLVSIHLKPKQPHTLPLPTINENKGLLQISIAFSSSYSDVKPEVSCIPQQLDKHVTLKRLPVHTRPTTSLLSSEFCNLKDDWSRLIQSQDALHGKICIRVKAEVINRMGRTLCSQSCRFATAVE